VRFEGDGKNIFRFFNTFRRLRQIELSNGNVSIVSGKHGVAVKRIPDDFYERIKPRLLERIGEYLNPSGTILDIGCGGCELVKHLAQKHRGKVIGVDIASGGFPHERRTGDGIEFQCIARDARELDFAPDGAIDAVVSMWALHEMERPQAVLDEALRVLKPGGQLLVVDFPRGSLAQRLWNENYYSPRQTQVMLERSGFTQTNVELIERGQVMWATGVCSTSDVRR